MKELDNLVKINKLKIEPFDATEFSGMLRAGDIKLKGALGHPSLEPHEPGLSCLK